MRVEKHRHRMNFEVKLFSQLFQKLDVAGAFVSETEIFSDCHPARVKSVHKDFLHEVAGRERS